MTDEKQNEVSESKEIPHEINSVSDLSQILQTLGEPKEGYTRFFRGHGDEGWQMLPSIYREDYLIENEDKIIKDALTYCPDDFLPSDTLFEKLVKLQHYGYSTRLLDLTTNALVALYFASLPYINPKTTEEEKKDGEFIILDIPDTEIKYGDSDTVAILSAISLQNIEFNIKEILFQQITDKIAYKMINKLVEHKKISEVKGEYIKIVEDLIEKQPAFEVLRESKGGKDIINNNRQIDIDVLIEIAFNEHKMIIRILHDIHTDKPNFLPIINYADFERILCVRAKLNNQRISRQQGCFLLFGIKGSKTKAAVIPDEWQRLASNRQKVLVKADRKDAIKKELESFGISKRTLFPELEAQAKEIMDYYKGQK